MGNCLVTKLKGTVDNSNLKKLGVITLEAKHVDGTMNASRCQLRLATNDSVTISVVGSGYFVVQNYSDLEDPSKRLTTYTINTPNVTNVFYFSNGNYKVEITNKYSVINIGPNYTSDKSVLNLDVADLDYSLDMEVIQLEGVANGDIAFIDKLSKVTLVDLRDNPDLVGDISVFKNNSHLYLNDLKLNTVNGGLIGDVLGFSGLTALTTLQFAHCKGITGNISSLAGLTNLLELSIADSGVSGDIASLNTLTKVITLTAYVLPNLTGNVNSIGNLKDLEVFGVANTGITGSIESLLDIIAPVRDAANHPTLKVTFNGKITYNSTAVPNNTPYTFRFANGSWTKD